MSKHIASALDLLKYVKMSPTFFMSYDHEKGVFEEGNVHFSYVIRCAFAVSVTLVGVMWNVWETQAFEEVNTYIKLFRSFIVVRCLMLSYTQKKNMARFANNMMNVDEYLEQNGIIMKYRIQRRYVLVRIPTVIFIVFANILLTWSYTKSFQTCLVNFGVYGAPYIINSLILVQYIFVVLFMRERIAVLNRWLAYLIISENSSKNIKSNACDELRRIKILYHKLFQIVTSMNMVFSEQISLTLWLAGMQVLHCAHSLIKSSTLLMYQDIFWLSIAFFDICIIIIPCSSLHRLAKRTPQILNMLITIEEELEFEKYIFLTQIYCEDIKFVTSFQQQIDESIIVDIVQRSINVVMIALQLESTLLTKSSTRSSSELEK